MTGIHWLLGAALAAAQPAAFPCDKLAGELLESYDRFESVPAPAPAPVEIRKKAVLFERTAALVAETFTLDDSARSGGKPLLFRQYRDGAQTWMCTRMRNDALFGTGDQTSQFLLRCLGDRDGDGGFEGFTRRVPLVRVNSMGRSIGARAESPAAPEASPWLPFSRPVRLIAGVGVVDPNAAFRPRARTRIVVSRVQGNEVELGVSGGISSLPDHVESRIGTQLIQTPVRLTMREGEVATAGGTRIRFARRGGKMTGTVLDGFGSEPQLLCSGSVAQVGDNFTILGAGHQGTFTRASLPPTE